MLQIEPLTGAIRPEEDTDIIGLYCSLDGFFFYSLIALLQPDAGFAGTCQATFLEDLDALEAEGITHPDVGKARRLLEGE